MYLPEAAIVVGRTTRFLHSRPGRPLRRRCSSARHSARSVGGQSAPASRTSSGLRASLAACSALHVTAAAALQ